MWDIAELSQVLKRKGIYFRCVPFEPAVPVGHIRCRNEAPVGVVLTLLLWVSRFFTYAEQGTMRAMIPQRASNIAVLSLLVHAWVFDVSAVYAAEASGTANTVPAAIVSGVDGNAMVTASGSSTSRPVGFHDRLSIHSAVSTSPGAVVDALVGRQVLVTLYPESTARFTGTPSASLAVELLRGTLRVATADTERPVIVKTPTVTLRTYGALVLITAMPLAGSHNLASPSRGGVQPAARHAPTALNGNVVETVVVLEGRVYLEGAMDGSVVALQAGQSRQFIAGQAQVDAPVPPAPRGSRLAASAKHALVPTAVLEYVATRDRREAEVIQQALSAYGDSPDFSTEFRNVILATSLGTANAQGQTAPSSVTLPGPPSPPTTSPVPSPQGSPGTPLSPAASGGTAPAPILPTFTGVVIPTSVTTQASSVSTHMPGRDEERGRGGKDEDKGKEQGKGNNKGLLGNAGLPRAGSIASLTQTPSPSIPHTSLSPISIPMEGILSGSRARFQQFNSLLAR
jgi:hypothetical protein